jgi:hypothetical protein
LEQIKKVPSSISVFNKPNAARAITVLLAALLLYCCALELGTRIGFARISKTQRRTVQDMKGAAQLLARTADGETTVLVVGNSLLLHGVISGRLHQTMAPGVYSFVFGVENTQFLDWYFGLRRLFAEGSRPSVVVVCLTARQLISSGTDGEYAAHYLTRGSDILRLKEQAQLDNTTASNLFFANLSAWLGSRAMIRNWLLGEVLPNVDELIRYLPEKAGALPATQIVVSKGLERLQQLEELCKSNGSGLILLMPPLASRSDLPEALQAAAAQRGIVVLVPYKGGEMPAAYFEDGFHLNSQGAAAFTDRLGPQLSSVIRRN